MINFYSGKIADGVISTLVGNTCSAQEISESLQRNGFSFSTAGLYKALKQLEDDGVIVKLKKQYSINNEWRQSIVEELGYQESIELEDGESVVFTFRSAEQADKHWKHFATLLHKESAGGVCFYNPHQFWILVPGRLESEERLINSYKERSLNLYHTVGGTTEFDKAFRRTYSGGTYQIYLEKVGMFSDDEDVTIFGDYIITTSAADDLYKEIDSLYRESTCLDDLKNGVVTLMHQPHDFKMKFERNHKKAAKFSKRLKKNFV